MSSTVTCATTEERVDVIDLTYTTTEDEEDDVRLEGFVVSDSEIEYVSDTQDDDAAIVNQATALKDLGTTFTNGRRVSTRARKPTVHYVHPDAAEVHKEFMTTASSGAESGSDMSAGSAWDGYDQDESDDADENSEDDT